jgi:hypothetical protein
MTCQSLCSVFFAIMQPAKLDETEQNEFVDLKRKKTFLSAEHSIIPEIKNKMITISFL